MLTSSPGSTITLDLPAPILFSYVTSLSPLLQKPIFRLAIHSDTGFSICTRALLDYNNGSGRPGSGQIGEASRMRNGEKEWARSGADVPLTPP